MKTYTCPAWFIDDSQIEAYFVDTFHTIQWGDCATEADKQNLMEVGNYALVVVSNGELRIVFDELSKEFVESQEYSLAMTTNWENNPDHEIDLTLGNDKIWKASNKVKLDTGNRELV